MFAALEHFGCVFQERLYLHTANKSVSGRFCHGLKHRGGNKPHIHVSDNRLMDANVCWAFPTPPTWLLRLTKIWKCLHICKCMLYLYWVCSNWPNGLLVCKFHIRPVTCCLDESWGEKLNDVNRYSPFKKKKKQNASFAFFPLIFAVYLHACFTCILGLISSSDCQVFFDSTRTESAHLWIWIGEKC